MRPQRGSRATSTTGVSASLTPRARISRAVTALTARTSAGSQLEASAMACGKLVAPTRRVAVQPFLVKQDGNAEPRVRQGIALQRIHQPNRAADIAPGHHARRGRPGGIRGPRKLTDAVRILLRHFRRIELQFGVEHLRLGIPDAEHLSDLFLQRHARQQILDARLDRRCGILVDRLAAPAAAAAACCANARQAATLQDG